MDCGNYHGEKGNVPVPRNQADLGGSTCPYDLLTFKSSEGDFPLYSRTIPSGSPYPSQDCNQPSLNFALSRDTVIAGFSKLSCGLESGPPRHKSCGVGLFGDANNAH